MNSAHNQDRFLPIGEVARIWRVSPDSLRGWARKGKLHPVATPGGQSRFRESELIAVLGDPRTCASGGSPAGHGPDGASGHGRTLGRSSRGGFRAGLETGNPELDEAREELEITRARHQTGALRREMAHEAQEAAKSAESERIHREHAARHDELKAHGRSLASGLPIEWRQRVISLLEGFVCAKNVPASLPDHEARALVAAQVQQIRKEYDARRWQELNETAGRWRVERLIQDGEAEAVHRTFLWDSRDAEDARAEVARDLARTVKPDWTEADVRRRVERILDQWEDVGDDEEEDDDDGDDQGDDGEDGDAW